MKWAESMFYKIKKKLKKPSGQSLIELLVAMGVFILVISGILFLALDSQVANRQGEERTKATGLASEGLEAAKSIKNRGWKYLTNGQHGLTGIGSFWEFAGTENNIEQFNRQVTVENVHRNENGEIVETEGNIDFDTKKISSKINWSFTPERPSQVLLASYLTNWKSTKWFQTTKSDFDQNTNKNNVITTQTADGEVQLATTPSGTDSYDWTFDNQSDYNFDPQKIEVAGGKAQLVWSSQPVNKSTQNPGFEGSSSPWTYADWSQGPSEPNVTGTWQSSGGHPTAWVNINIPRSKQGGLLGGYWQQSFTTTTNNPQNAFASFDWQISQFNGLPFSFTLYAFIETNAGEPTIDGPGQIWTSGDITSTKSWTTVTNINISSKISSASTYYFKLALWAELPGGKISTGPFTVGYDNAQIQWQEQISSYPTDRPSISPKNSFNPNNIYSWLSFSETATKNGGEIYYQLSNNDGSTWQFWNGSTWTQVINPTDYNTASVINSNIGSFPITNQKILFKAFLTSNGSQQVILDNIKIEARKIVFASSGDFESSVFDSNSTTTNYNYIAWAADVPAGTNLKFQIRAAATKKLLYLSKWIGPDEDSFTYFENPGEIMPDLNNTQYIQYKAYFTSSGQNTAVLKDVTIDYET